ncbi:hypothetical protein LTR47_011252 [Exophiala xenobiotica]|nr:hypothetical protein LTR92_010753 [Exophiala xenobiotica]KAK5202972.1 hypothetical protein LTR41_011290 [Exophiala xenobiotica]KAK5215241.1 hypothetical protein LTR72_011694 [Exophiala xenobiotica]KAK5220309.1 hypothetical protein LTR47_011252 [Exophiala xenobiotica]KAK5247784.1 hypothetical protein LTS06_007087 [Exophiala xenobiotica]
MASGGRNRASPAGYLPLHSRGRGRGLSGGDIHQAVPRGRGQPRGSGRGRGLFPQGDDPNVRRVEDKILAVTSRSRSNTNGHFPERPGFGTKGRGILLWTNYFELTAYGNLILYRYSITVAPDRNGKIPAGKKQRRLVQLLLEEHFDQHETDIVTDFKSNVLSRVQLDLEDEYQVTYRDEEAQEPSPNATTYRITMGSAAVLSFSDVLDLVTSTQSNALFASKEHLIQALNIVIGHHPKATAATASIGANNHFDTTPGSDRFRLGAGLQAIRGFFVSVRAATARILVNVQVKHGAFYEEGPLDRLMHAFMEEHGPEKTKLEVFLKKISVNVTHIQRKDRHGGIRPRIKQINALASPGDGRELAHPPIIPSYGAGPKAVMFFLASIEPASASSGPRQPAKGTVRQDTPQGKYISVFDFFKRTYDIVIQYHKLPVVNVGTCQNPSYLPAEVCEVRSGQHTSKQLSPFQTQNMIRFAVRSPEENARTITTSGVALMGIEPLNATLEGSLGIQIKPNLLCVPGRILNSPAVRYHGSGTINSRLGSWNLQGVRFPTSVELPYWTYLALSVQGTPVPWTSDQALLTALEDFAHKLTELGIHSAKYTPGMTVTLVHSSFESQIDDAIHKFMHSTKRSPPKLVLVVLPSKDKRIYDRVKYACDVKEGVLNICVVASKFLKTHNDQYFANVALKVNLKLGGRNHYLENPQLGVIAEGKTMVVGLDVTHPSPGSAKTAPSIGGIVASIDRWLGQWPADLLILPPRQETMTGLQPLIVSRLKLWHRQNSTFPDNILVYRDGVSESQYGMVLEEELPLFRAACKELYPAQMTSNGFPRITIVVVGKRHHTRFYPTRIEDADKSSNPLNGTVVDRGVTEARNWDFFLQAHTALQGTARPAHYYIVLDEIFRRLPAKQPFQNAADVLEDLTHNLCYLFGRATKAVSICPPAYYADLVCERARCYMSSLFDPDSTDRGSSSGQTDLSVDATMIKVHSNVANSMFYI